MYIFCAKDLVHINLYVPLQRQTTKDDTTTGRAPW